MTLHRIILIIVTTIFTIPFSLISALAADATFSWLPNSAPIAGYKIHYGINSGNYTSVVNVGLPAAVNGRIVKTVTGLSEGQTYYFAATAYTASEESGYSTEVVFTTPVTGSSSSDVVSTNPDTTPPAPPVDSSIPSPGSEDTPAIVQPDSDGVVDDPGDPANSPPFSIEAGEISVGSQPSRIQFTNNFSQPVIIANAITGNDPSPCVVSVSNVTSDGFDIQLQEYDYQDNIHGVETVNYIVMEEGSYILEDGSQVEAGLIGVNAAKFKKTRLMMKFDSKPIVLTSVNSRNYPETVTSRIKNITSASFKVKLQEQESNKKNHGTETVAYLAWSQGSGVTNGICFLAGKTKDVISHKTKNINFTQPFNNLPYHFGVMQTADGGDPSTLKITRAAIDNMDVKVEEETSKNSEIKHTKEIAGYLIIAPE